MTSTTSSKKELIDFLWEWAEGHGDWGKLLITKVVTTENHLTTNERETIFNYFLQSINLFSGLPELNVTKPTYSPTSKHIELVSLSEISGVNKLAKNQTINFAPNITVIYGENATGKTGYSRILKSLGISYDSENTIYSNIFGSSEPKSALINFKVDDSPFTFKWDGSNKNSELENISVFNSNCVRISLSDRQLIVSPIGFHLFNLVSDELNELEKLLESKINTHSIKLPWSDTLNDGTPQKSFINTLSATSTEEKLDELSSFSSEQELKDSEEELFKLNKALLQHEIADLELQESEISSTINKIQSDKSVLSNSIWQRLIELNNQLKKLQSQTQKGLKEIAGSAGIEFYKTEEFIAFIMAADDYIKILNDPKYPTTDDICIYCNQPLESSAIELLTSYRELLNDPTQEVIDKLNQQKNELIDSVSKVDFSVILNHPSFGNDKNNKPIQPAEITNYNTKLKDFKTTFVSDNVLPESTFDYDQNKILELLSNKKNNMISVLGQKKELLLNIALKETELRSKICELKDRKLFSVKKSEIKTAISNHKIIASLKHNSTNFNTNSISRKTTEAREELVRQNFNNSFQTELSALRKSNLRVNLNFATERGTSTVSQNIANHLLSDILSEGEQKAIALAEFLTELQLDGIVAPVIFDDPVNSLDHRIIDEVAKRLIELSKQRQVIIFTHSILLLHSLIQQSELEHNKQANINFLFHRVKENFGTTGILDEVEEINSFSYYTKKLNLALQTKPEGHDESQLAAEGYGSLRSAIEITVEDDLFKKTIKRYKKGVAFPSLLRVEGGKIDKFKGKINDIYEKCCVSIVGHSSPQEVSSTPTISELKIDFENFKEIRKNFTG